MELLSFLRIPYLVVTDLDLVTATGQHSTCRADTATATTSNITLKKLCGKSTVAELIALTNVDKQHKEMDRCIAFQIDISVIDGTTTVQLRPRTIEEALAYQNFPMVRSGAMSLGIAIPASINDAYEAIYKRVHSDSFKKTDFAMSILASAMDWQVPNYIAEGLQWLEVRLCSPAVTVEQGAA